MRKIKRLKALISVSWRHILPVFFVVILFSHISQSPSWPGFFLKGPFEFLTVREASAQAVDPSAKSKYEAGLDAMKRGDCQAATTLFKQAIASDPTDRAVRVGMFSTDYLPNAKLREAQAKCPSSAPVPAPAPAPLALNISSPQTASLTLQNQTDQTTVEGSVQGGEGGFKVVVNGRDVQVRSDGRFSASVPLSVGTNEVTVRASDSKNNAASKRIVITRLAKEAPPPTPQPPSAPPTPVAPLALTVSSPTEAEQTVPFETDNLTVKGFVEGGKGSGKVAINGKDTRVDSTGSFSARLPLQPGRNKITVKVTDGAGSTKTKQFLVTRSQKPAPSAPLVLTVTSPSESIQSVAFDTDKISIAGSVKGGEGAPQVTVNNKNVKTDRNGSFSASMPLEAGDNKLTVVVRDSTGKEQSREFVISRLAKVFPPAVLSVTSPAQPKQSVPFETDKIEVAGSVKGGEGAPQVTVNNKDVKTGGGGSFSVTLPLDAGENRLTVRFRDSAGKEDSREFVVTRLAKVAPPPLLGVTSPSEPKQSVPFETDKIEFAGSVKGGEGAPQVKVNNKNVITDSGGSFSASVPLDAGENKVAVVVRDSAGREDSREFVITRLAKVVPPPVLSVTSPSESKQSVPFEADKIEVAGSVKGGEGAPQVTVNNKKVKTDSGGSFSTSVPLDAGENRLTVVAKDSAGKEDRRELSVTRLAKVFAPPVLNVTSPSEPMQSVPFETDKIAVGGSVKGGEGASKITVNDKEVKTNSDGSFTTSIILHTGDNEVTVKVKDSGGKEDARKFLITRLAKVFAPPVLNVTSPSEPKQSVPFETDKIAVGGSVTDGEGAPKVTVNDREASTDSGGSFFVTIPLHVGENRVVVKVEDAAGRKAARDFVISRNEGPPPVLRVSTPTDADEDGKVSLQGTISGGTGQLKLILDGQEVPIGKAGTFATRIALKSGKNRVTLQVEDSAGKRDSQVWYLFNYPTAGKK
jgi:uncharacterized protein YfaP (DUF2135 family)